ncbi:UDP-3-O-acyl-N-acetylglucosamine deacetylase [Pararhizobium haloflavum]|uniref:UDP-3-O-acyl-N-acetylglucosamine deacetylase n=1 Tax=Pararhizobium haloflavum TaxID=2037914 RepID=UPI000C195C56|nr:UDP-3-O-acyl-N-acetylglucosamine deacetylase [Pararhizobium haloflavum]
MTSSWNVFQTTIARPVSLAGIGVHSGKDVHATFLPADPDSGVVLRRVFDNGRTHDIRAVSAQVASTDLSTVLSRDGITIGTVEHLMAAFAGLGVDNVVVELDGGEVPIMDGSAEAFVEAIDSVGLSEQDVKRRFIRVRKPVRVEMGGSWGEFVPHDGQRFEIEIDFDSPVIGRQNFESDLDPATFRSALARSRTFGFMRDVERLWAAGYALGASLENSVVVADDDRVINVEGLRFKDEFVRHKALDAVGDLALAGAPFIGCFRSYRGGHKLNALALKALLDDLSAYDVVEAPGRRDVRRRRGDVVAINAPAFAPWTL